MDEQPRPSQEHTERLVYSYGIRICIRRRLRTLLDAVVYHEVMNEIHPTGIKTNPTGIKTNPTGIKTNPTGIKTNPTGINEFNWY